MVHHSGTAHLLSGNAWVTEQEVLEVLTIMSLRIIPVLSLLFNFFHHISVNGRNKTMKAFPIKWSVTMPVLADVFRFFFSCPVWLPWFCLHINAHQQCPLENLHCVVGGFFVVSYECWMGSLNIYPLFSLRNSPWLRCGFIFLFWGEDSNVLFTVFTLLLSKKMERLQRWSNGP